LAIFVNQDWKGLVVVEEQHQQQMLLKALRKER
jgi:hypothetical protein